MQRPPKYKLGDYVIGCAATYRGTTPTFTLEMGPVSTINTLHPHTRPKHVYTIGACPVVFFQSEIKLASKEPIPCEPPIPTT